LRQKESIPHVLCLFLTALIWGLAFTAQVKGMDSMEPLQFGAVRFTLGAISLIPVFLIFERKKNKPVAAKRKATWGYGAATGVVLFIASTLQQLGISANIAAGNPDSASKSGFITGLYIVLVPIIGIFLGKKNGFVMWIGTALAIAGLYFISVPNGFGKVGWAEILLMVCAVFWAVHILIVDACSQKILPLRFSFVQFAVCAALSWVGSLVIEPRAAFPLAFVGWLPVLYGGLLSVGVAYTLQIVGQQRVAPSKAALIFSLESFFAAVGGILLLHEHLTWKGYLGCALIFCGIICSQIPTRKHSPAAA
jgi:drug/metabolite transporter (DMT)-like permease